MPNNIKHTAPSLTINEVKGWQSRILYNYYGRYDSGLMDYVSETSSDYTLNLFSIIDAYQSGVASYPIQKGLYEFPSKYFTTGKSIKVEGQFLVSANSNKFNIHAKIDNSNNDIISLSSTNNGNNHDVAAGGIVEDLPIYFKIIYTAVERYDGGASPTTGLYMMANGHYQYEYDSYNGGKGSNTSVVYVPIWTTSPYVLIDDTTGINKLSISFDNSNTTVIKLVYMTVEELS